MNISFLRDDPLRSTVVDSHTDDTIYTISTTETSATEETTVMRDSLDTEIAVWRQRSWNFDLVTFRGHESKLCKWLPRKNVFSSVRVLTGPEGKTYHWMERPTFFELVDVQMNEVVARSYSGRPGLVTGRRMSLDVYPPVAHILDAILFSFSNGGARKSASFCPVRWTPRPWAL